MADAAAFSFYPAKNLGACGDGGMVVTKNAAIADRIRMARNYGQREKYHHQIQGHNHRLDSLQAAILRVRLRRLDEANAARARHARLYSELLEGAGVTLPVPPAATDAVWHLYVIRDSGRDALKNWLASRGIATGIHYPIPIHQQPAYRELGYRKGDFPVSDSYADQILSLPMYPSLKPEIVEYVSTAVREFSKVNPELPEPAAV